MTRPSAPAVIISGTLLAVAGVFLTEGIRAGDWITGTTGVLFGAFAVIALASMWDAPPAPDDSDLEAILHATREDIDKEVADFAAELEHW